MNINAFKDSFVRIISRFCFLQSHALIATVLVLGCLSGESEAQSLSSQQDIDATIEELMETADRVRDRLRSPATSLPKLEPIIPDTASRNDADIASSAKSQADDIRQRIRLIRRMKSTPSAPDLRVTPTESRPPYRAEPSTEMPSAQGTLSPATTEPTLRKIDQSIDVQAETPEVQTDPAPPIQATQVLPSAINALDLGQSLYQTKNYAAALKAFQSVDVTKLTQADQTWLELLTALCHRRLGNLDTANATLREISNANSNDYPIPVARWWLSQGERTDGSRQLANDLAETIEPLIERTNKYVNANR
ncbi:hypothetical protein Pla52n_32070 [Stieleria varia]|uniref:Tetratricopeptide repeat protein n=2 Tax=Stieleria varia TaxID=2528005 RepID=A0A5C6ARH1_9BACT|nr:hypothetical protein Pla52n_32070 [Stieleria varia]